MSEEVRIALEEVTALASNALLANGMSAEQSRAIADNVTRAERDECKSHGLFRIAWYVGGVRSATIVPDAVPVLGELAPAVVKVDAGGGFAPLAQEVGADALTEKARQHGLAALAITRCSHVAALWPEVEVLAERGLVAFAFTSAICFVAPAGGVRPLFGTNPMAFAWPRENRPPLVFDQASSVSARGEIMLHKRDGKVLPEGWAINADGKPTTDPSAALAGAQLPFGGHKGAAIAMMVELLAGALIGEYFSFEAMALESDDTKPSIGGEFMLAIDPIACVGHNNRAAQLAHGEKLFAKILEQDGTRLPSDRRLAARERTPTEGVVIPETLHKMLLDMAKG